MAADCNHRKADRLIVELGWQLHAARAPPKGKHWRLLAKKLDPSWLQYLPRARRLSPRCPTASERW